MAKVSCIFRHRGIQLILAYSWVRSAILVAGKGRRWGDVYISSVSSLSFLFLFLPYLSLSSPLLSLLPLSGRRHKMTQRVDVSLNPNNQFIHDLMTYATSIDPDQPAYPRSLIRVYAFR